MNRCHFTALVATSSFFVVACSDGGTSGKGFDAGMGAGGATSGGAAGFGGSSADALGGTAGRGASETGGAIDAAIGTSDTAGTDARRVDAAAGNGGTTAVDAGGGGRAGNGGRTSGGAGGMAGTRTGGGGGGGSTGAGGRDAGDAPGLDESSKDAGGCDSGWPSTATTGRWVQPDGTACVNGPHLVPAADACEWQPCKDEPMPAVVYYVCNTGGDDSRSAATAKDPTTPWKTVSKAVSQFRNLNAGEAIAFCRGGTFEGGGVYHNERGTPTNPTIVRDYTRPGREGMGDPRPIFTGKIEDFVEVGRVKFMNLACNTQNTNCIFTYDNLIGDVTFCNVELAAKDVGAEIAGGLSVSGIKIEGARFINNPNQGWLGSGQNLEISHSYFHNNGSQNTMFNHSVYLGSHGGTSKGFVLRGNEIHPPAATEGTAVVFHGSNANVLIENNIVNFDIGKPQAGGWGIAQGCGGYAPEPSNGDHFTMRGNTVVNAGNMSLGIGCCQHCVLENNLVINTQQSTLALGASQEEATGQSGYSPSLQVSTDVLVRNNTVYLSKGGIGIRAGFEGANTTVENNVVQSNETCFKYGTGGFDARDYNLSDGCNDAAVGTHSSKKDPMWIAPGTDFHPANGSSLVGAGDPTQNPGVDLTGAVRPSPPSLGAYEP